MTETSTEPPGPPVPPPGPTTGQSDQGAGQSGPGVDRDHLRNYEQLRRSRVDRKIAGVAGGLGRHLNVDPTVLRVLFVVLSLFGGAGLFLYVAAWLLVPEEGHQDAAIRTSPNTRNLLLIGAGALALLGVVGNGWNQFWVPWPLLVVGAVVLAWLVAKDQNGPRSSSAPASPVAPGSASAPTDQVTAAGYTPAGPPPWAPAGPSAYTPPPPPPRRKKTGPKLFGPTLALIAIALGTLGIVDAAGVDVAEAAYAALALTITGAMLVLGAFFGRAGGLTLVGIIAAVTLAGSTWGPGFDGEGDTKTYSPLVAAQVEDAYRVDAGQIRLDLSKVIDPQDLAGETIRVSADAGEISVVLPEGVPVAVDAAIDGPGQINLPGDETGGIGTELDGTYNTDEAGDVLTIEARADFGHIEVTQP